MVQNSAAVGKRLIIVLVLMVTLTAFMLLLFNKTQKWNHLLKIHSPLPSTTIKLPEDIALSAHNSETANII